MKHLFFCITFSLLVLPIFAQVTEQAATTDTTGRKQSSVVIDYTSPTKCVIAGLQVTGVNYLNADQILPDRPGFG